MSSLLFGVAPIDPLTDVVVVAVVATVATLATWLPARQAARVDPRSDSAPSRAATCGSYNWRRA